MIKNIIKILLTIFLILLIATFYLSIFGLKTEKFNKQITNNILKVNNKINLSLNEVSYLLNPYNFTINIKTKNPQILLEGRNLRIKEIQTKVTLKSLIKDQFWIEDLKITTKEVKISDIISLLRIFQNSPKLFILDTIIKDGFVSANINLKFDKDGGIKENYKIDGSIEQAKLNILNKFKLKNLNLNFYLEKNTYLLSQIETKFNNIEIILPSVEIKKKNNSFFVNGQVINNKKNFSNEDIKLISPILFNNIDVKKIEFNSKSDFSFKINKNLKFKNFKVKSSIDLKKLTFNQKYLELGPYLPSFIEEVKLEGNKIVIKYEKNKFDIKGNGIFLLEDKSDKISYQIIKTNNSLSFNSKINIKNNQLLINFLDYEKKEGLDSSILIKGIFKKDDQLSFDLISLNENGNQILIKDLNLNKNFKIIDIKNFKINYKNNQNILNKLNLKKDNLNFILEGESFDASRIINNIIDADDKSLSIFDNLNSKINIKIKKTYINEIDYLNNLYGSINFNNNKINDLKLESLFPNKKKISLFIKKNNNLETITRLFSSYPKPLIKRYKFIKGFEEGNLDFYSSKKNGVSNSLLIIDNFKVKEVPIFAKLLSLSSLQGIADLLTGEGIRFTDLEMNFSSQKGLTTIEEMYAIGPAVSILMNGYIESKKLVSLRGTLVPATTINRSIASIPLLGKILIGDKTGEGVFGVSFKIKGSPKDLKTTVNPIKSLTPRFITRTIEKIKKN